MSDLIDRKVVDRSGEDIGKVTDVIADPINLHPEWLVVKLGWLAGEHLVPVAVVEDKGDRCVAAFGKADVRTAPRVKDHRAPGGHERDALYRHYGMNPPAEKPYQRTD